MTARILLFIVLITLCLSCENNESDVFKFEAEVIGKGIDCGDTFLIDLKNISGDLEIEDGTYYAYPLPETLKAEGIEIELNCRLPNSDEARACTMLGPSFPHIWVLEVKPKEE